MKNIFFLVLLSYSFVGCSPLQKITEMDISISESTWVYTDSDGDNYEITFNSNKKVKTTNPNDNTFENDYWYQKGRNIKFEFNKGYSKYSGKMKTLDLIKGKAKSIKGKWKWTLKRKL